MSADLMYAPRPTEQTIATAMLAAARHFGTEAITPREIAQDRIDQVLVYRVDGRHPRGWDLLGDSVIVTVHDDGTTTVDADA